VHDTAGQEDYDRLRPLSYPNTHVFLVCYSLLNPVSLRNAFDKWIPEARHHCPGAKLLLVGLKADLRDEPSYVSTIEAGGRAVVDESTIGQVVAQLSVGHIPTLRCSALTQVGVKDVFDCAIREVRAPPPPPDSKRSPLLRMLLALFSVRKKSAGRSRSEKRHHYAARPVGVRPVKAS
jgi:GTPase SAR1 family protein